MPSDPKERLVVSQAQIVLPEKEWISNAEEWTLVARTQGELASNASNISSRNLIVIFLLRAYGCLLASSMLIFFLQGFNAWGFNLPESLLKWLGGATVGEIAGLLTIAMKSLFESKHTTSKPRAKQKRAPKKIPPSPH